MNKPMLALIAPSSIGPAPLPIEISAVEAKNQATGEKMVVLQVVTPAGVTFGFISQDQAKQLGEVLLSCGTGIAVVPAGSRLQ